MTEVLFRALFSALLLVATSIACVHSIIAQKVAFPTIQGKLVRSDLKPVPYTEIELVPLDMDHVPNDSRLIGVSDTWGRFRFTDVPAGKYTMSINFGDKPTFLSPFATFFYPATSIREKAMVFAIDKTTRLKEIVFKLQTELVKKPIRGRITWPDGKPVLGAVIACRDIEFDVKNDFGSTRSDKNGNFSLEAFVGRRYQLGVMLFDRDMRSPFEPGEIIAIGESGEFTLSRSQGFLEIKLVWSRDTKRMLDKYVG